MSNLVAKRVSNYELFFDLVFVLAVSNLTGLLHGELTSKSFFTFIAANLVIMSIWIFETFYMNSFGERDLRDILTITALMFAVGNLSFHISTDYSAHALPFAFLVTISYGIIALQYVLRGRASSFTHEIKHAIRFMGSLTLIFALSCVAILSNFWFFNEWSLLFFVAPIFLPLVSHRNYDQARIINFPHFLERLQLITIITFGETVVAILKTYQDDILIGGIFFFGMASLFFLYISQTFLNINHHQRVRVTLLSYVHNALLIGLNLFTVGIEAISNLHHRELGATFIIIGIAIFYLALMATSTYNQERYRLTLVGSLIYALWISLVSLTLYILREQFLPFIIVFLIAMVMSAWLFIYERQRRLKY